jgi:hypothetical protein
MMANTRRQHKKSIKKDDGARIAKAANECKGKIPSPKAKT